MSNNTNKNSIIKRLEDENQQLKKELDEIQERIDNSIHSFNRLKNYVLNLELLLNRCNEQNNNLSRENIRLRTEINRCNQENVQLRREQMQLRQDLQQQISERNNELGRLRQQLSNLQPRGLNRNDLSEISSVYSTETVSQNSETEPETASDITSEQSSLSQNDSQSVYESSSITNTSRNTRNNRNRILNR